MDKKPIVRVSQGLLQGIIGKNINGEDFYKFHGIPYAKPPLGVLRFKDPQQPENWEGLLDASKEASACYNTNLFNTIEGSEDCLYLNVYVKNLAEKQLKPVMVWIHGGSFMKGSSSTTFYGPEFLLNENIVLVTINYRIGVLGFLSLESPSLEVSGNAGLKDQNMALKWVQNNIINFGGDPNNVTLFGESSGSSSTHYHILSPRSKGLFHKAILQSGSALSVWGQGSRCCKDLLKALGKNVENEKEALDVLRAISIEELHSAQTKMHWFALGSKKRAIGPIVERESESAFIWREPKDILLSGEYNHVPMIFGYCSKEGLLVETMLPKEEIPKLKFDHFVPWMMNVGLDTLEYKEITNKIEEFYSTGDYRTDIHTVCSDAVFVLWILASVRHHVKTCSFPIFLYKVTVESGLNLMKIMRDIQYPGVCHFDECGYLFKNFTTPNIQKGSIEETSYKAFIRLWTNFAKYGNPTPDFQESGDPTPDFEESGNPTPDFEESGNPTPDFEESAVNWKPVEDSGDFETLVIGKKLEIRKDLEKRAVEFWRNLFMGNKFVGDYF